MMKPSPIYTLLLELLLTLDLAGVAEGQQTSPSVHTASSSLLLAARLRRALPLPSASLSNKMALSLGIGFSPTRGFSMFTGAEAAETPLRATALSRALRNRPQDASGYELLAEYEGHLGQAALALRASTMAAVLYQQQARKEERTSPSKAEAALAGRSRALCNIGKTQRAEAELHQALRHRPRSWKLWDALGNVEENRAEAMVTDVTHADKAAVVLALRLDGNAYACYNRAVRVGYGQGLAYAARGDFLGSDRPALKDQIKRLHGETVPLFETVTSAAALADFRQAARLLPRDPYAVAYPVWQEVSVFGFFRSHLPFPSQAVWHALPASARHHAREALGRLERLAQGRDRRLAQRADVPLGFLRYETQRAVEPAEAALRLGLSGPDHRKGAEMLMHVMSLEGQNQALASFCQAEAHVRNTPRLHVIAAWAETQQEHWPQAREEMRQALELEPSDPADLVTLAVISLKADGGEAGLDEAGALLGQAGRAQGHVPPSDPLRTELRVTHAFYLALSGDTDAAETEMRAVVAKDPHNAGAEKGLAILTRE